MNLDVHDLTESGELIELRALLDRDPAAVNRRTKSGNQPLHLAAWQGHLDCIGLLLSYNPDVNARGDHERTPLHYACQHGHSDAVCMLLDAGADPDLVDAYGDSARLIAAEVGLGDLMAGVANRGDTLAALSAIAASVNSDRVSEIRQARLDIESLEVRKKLSDLLEIALQRLDNATLGRLLGEPDEALISKRGAVVTALLEAGASANGELSADLRPVHQAAQHCNPLALTILVNAGADLFAQSARSGLRVADLLRDNEERELFYLEFPELRRDGE